MHIKSCEVFQRNSKSVPRKAPLKNVDVITERCEKLALDIVGKLDRSKQGFSYILTGMDLATHFVFPFPMKSCSAEETVKNFIKIIRDLGIPSQILTNQGQHFIGKVMSEVTTKLAVNRIETSPYHPQSNGQLEHFHATLKSVFRKCTEHSRDWPEVLDLAIYYIRNMPHRVSILLLSYIMVLQPLTLSLL